MCTQVFLLNLQNNYFLVLFGFNLSCFASSLNEKLSLCIQSTEEVLVLFLAV